MNYPTPIIDGYNAVVGPTNNLPLDDILDGWHCKENRNE